MTTASTIVLKLLAMHIAAVAVAVSVLYNPVQELDALK